MFLKILNNLLKIWILKKYLSKMIIIEIQLLEVDADSANAMNMSGISRKEDLMNYLSFIKHFNSNICSS